jgi:mono/diheme cytochrome c family protein
MYQQPRDFQLGVFKCRSTPTGTLPTDQDLYDAITRGFDRSNMPQWNTLSKQERADLVAWVKHFSPRWANEKPGAPITIPPEPEVTPSASRRGATCLPGCSAGSATAFKVWPMGRRPRPLPTISAGRSQPFNFTEGSRPKCGDTDRDIYRIFMTGLDGTPMPSFADNIKPDEAWDLVFYLRTLYAPEQQGKRAGEAAWTEAG